MPDGKRLLRIGVLVTPTDPFWVQVGQFVAEELGPRLVLIDGENVKWHMTAEELADLQDELLTLELDAFVCLNLPAHFLRQLVEQGVPVISLDEAYEDYPGFPSSINWIATGRMICKYVAEKLQGKGHILCILGEEGEMDYNASRVAGIKETLTAYPDITISYLRTFWAYEKAEEDLEKQFLQLDRCPDAVLGLSDSLALAAREVGRKTGLFTRDPIIVGINGDPLALAAVAEGTLAATVHVKTKDFARQAADFAILAGEGKPVPERFHIYPTLVTKENVNDVANQKLMDIAMIPSKLVGLNRQTDQSRLKQLEISLALVQHVGSLLDRQQLLAEISQLIKSNYEFDEVHFYRWSVDEQTFSLETPPTEPQHPQNLSYQSAGLLSEAVRQNKPIFVLDALGSKRYPVDQNCPEVQSRCILPVPFGDRVFGVLDLRGKHPVRVRRLDLMGLQVLAEQMGIAMRNAELFTEAVEAKSAAEKADQLKTRLLANVSHELRAPLNVILGYTRVALNTPNPYQMELPDQLRNDLEHVYTSGEHLIRLINDLLDLSRAEIGELELFPETIATRAFLEEVFQSMANTDRDSTDVTWELHLPERLPVIQADPVRLRQVILNLLSNARKFTLSGKIILGSEVSPPYLHFWVQDTGPGIPFDQQELIFQPFVSIERNTRRPEGIGLGLSVTRRLVALHGGSITLDSTPTNGSTFHVKLPLPSITGQLPVVQTLPAQGDLLLLSDQAKLPEPIIELSQRMGWRVYRVNSENEINLISSETRPAVLFWDIGQRTNEDWKFIQRLCAHPKMLNLPLLIYGLDEVAPGLTLNGMTGIMPKPFNGRKLVDTINALCPIGINGSILIVDDELNSRKLYNQLISKALPGYDIFEADDGLAALKILETQMPNLVLLDLMMPGMDGFKTLENIRSNPSTRHLPIMVLSGKTLTKDDIERLDYARVSLQSKNLLTHEELEERLRYVFRGEDNLPQPTSRVVKMAISHIHQSYHLPFSRRTLAEAVGVTESYLSKIFHEEVGISPWEYLTRFRVNYAKELLSDTEIPVTLIASRVGFEDPAYFSRVFHKYTGYSPQAWRKRK